MSTSEISALLPGEPEVSPPMNADAAPIDAGLIQNWANSFFKDVVAGGVAAPPATPISPVAPWSAPAAPPAASHAQALPIQPPIGLIDPPSSVPSSAPLRSFGGASAGSAQPAAFAQSRAIAPAATQMLAAPPRIDPLEAPAHADITPETPPLSPFAAEIDLRGVLSNFASALQGRNPISEPAPQAAPTAAPATPDVPLRPSNATILPAISEPIAPSVGNTISGVRTFDAASLRNDFPILQQNVHGKRLIWLDNGATTQKPQAVIDRIAHFYAYENSNVHRGAHTLAARSTDAYESAREKVRRFVGASSTKEIIFVRGATEGVNLIAKAWGARNVKAGDEIVVTQLEHHANIVPWQQLCIETGARLRVAPVDNNGDILLDEYERLLGPRTRLVAFTQVSNALGTVTPAREIIAAAHRHGALTLVDAAQSVSHGRTDVQALDTDFLVLSGHKMFAPTGIGAVFGKYDILKDMPPWQGGGNMIADVTFEKTVYQPAPERFEAGTGNIADAVGLGAAIDYLDTIGMEAIAAHEHALIEHALSGLGAIPGLKLIGAPRERAGVISFVVDGCRTEDVGKALDREGIAVRSGHHCAQPILRRFGLESTVRPSFALYNTHEDVDALVAAVRRIALQAQGGSR